MNILRIPAPRALPYLWRGLLRFAIALVLIVGLCIGIFYFTFGRAFSRTTESVTDVSRYPELLTRERKNQGVAGLLAHMPDTQLVNTSPRPELFYQPAFLQGGGGIYVRLNLSAQHLSTELLRLRSSKVDTIGEPAPWAYDPFNKTKGLPLSDNYDVWHFVTQPKSNLPYRNHGTDAGIAIKQGTGEIIYWAVWW